MTAKVSKVSPQTVLRKASRRQEYSASTKRALVEVAAELFTEKGYAGTSLDEIVAGARVTKGALYHHFKGKQELFEAVFENVEEAATKKIRRSIKGVRDPWQKAVAGLRAFLEVTRTEAYRRVVIQEGPAVLGYERYREQEERTSYGIVQEVVGAVLETYRLPADTIEAFSRLFFGAMSATGSAVASADDPDAAAEVAEGAIVLVLAGLRQLVLSGEPLPTADDLISPYDDGTAAGA